mmetsp:Transcript_72632/g.157602  ORF Transcript_72632/g.157602 Transcript_72632/m.157602 type:complete len:106 (+) Transcript_72632:233-550(+)
MAVPGCSNREALGGGETAFRRASNRSCSRRIFCETWDKEAPPRLLGDCGAFAFGDGTPLKLLPSVEGKVVPRPAREKGCNLCTGRLGAVTARAEVGGVGATVDRR